MIQAESHTTIIAFPRVDSPRKRLLISRAIEANLYAADLLIAILDAMDGDADNEPSLAAPEIDFHISDIGRFSTATTPTDLEQDTGDEGERS